MTSIPLPVGCWYIVNRHQVLSGSCVFSMNQTKSVVSLIYDSCFLAIRCKSESMKLEIHSVGPPLPETIGLLTGFGLCIFVSV